MVKRKKQSKRPQAHHKPTSPSSQHDKQGKLVPRQLQSFCLKRRSGQTQGKHHNDLFTVASFQLPAHLGLT
jgi:hypothetical protein